MIALVGTLDALQGACSFPDWNRGGAAALTKEHIALYEQLAKFLLGDGHPVVGFHLVDTRAMPEMIFSNDPLRLLQETQRVRVHLARRDGMHWCVGDTSPLSNEADVSVSVHDLVAVREEVNRRFRRPPFVEAPVFPPIGIGTVVYRPMCGEAVPFEVIDALPVGADADHPASLTVRLWDQKGMWKKEECPPHPSLFANTLDPSLHRTPVGALYEAVMLLEQERDARLAHARESLARWSKRGKDLHALSRALETLHTRHVPLADPGLCHLLTEMWESFDDRRQEDARAYDKLERSMDRGNLR